MATFSNILATEKGQKEPQNFCCEICDYKCSKKYSWERHLLTLKHQESTNGNNLGAKGQITAYECENCGKEYSERTGLWKHKQKCYNDNNNENNDMKEIKEPENNLIDFLINENKELQKSLSTHIKSHLP